MTWRETQTHVLRNIVRQIIEVHTGGTRSIYMPTPVTLATQLVDEYAFTKHHPNQGGERMWLTEIKKIGNYVENEEMRSCREYTVIFKGKKRWEKSTRERVKKNKKCTCVIIWYYKKMHLFLILKRWILNNFHHKKSDCKQNYYFSLWKKNLRKFWNFMIKKNAKSYCP